MGDRTELEAEGGDGGGDAGEVRALLRKLSRLETISVLTIVGFRMSLSGSGPGRKEKAK